MSDTAQLREALEIGQFASWNDRSDHLGVVLDAARELLTIREAGVLIITPDEKTVERIAVCLENNIPELSGWSARHIKVTAQLVLDALRDAMPKEEK